MRERWKDVPGYEGFYEVSTHGRVRSVARVVVCRGGGTKSLKGVEMRPQRQRSGHLGVTLTRDCRKNRQRIHRLVMLAFVGACPAGLEVRHLDGDPENNVLWNLAYGTPSQNRLDAYVHGGRKVGGACHLAKMSDEDTARLISLRGSISSRRAAKLFNLNDSYVRQVWRGDRRRHA